MGNSGRGHERMDAALVERLVAERDAARADAEQGWALAARLYAVVAHDYRRHPAAKAYEAALAAREAR